MINRLILSLCSAGEAHGAKPLLKFLPQRVERVQALKHRKCKTQHNTDRMTSGWYYWNALHNKWIFRSFLKEDSEGSLRTLIGRLFHV